MTCRHLFGTTDPLREVFLCNACNARLIPERVSVSAAIARLPKTFEEFERSALEVVDRLVLPCPWLEPGYSTAASV